MNTAATHVVTNVAVRVEHKESIVSSFLKKALRFIEYDIEAVAVLGLFVVSITGIIVRLSQLSNCALVVSCLIS